MLKELKISNYALIDGTEIRFGEGMQTVTGATGAGKSIMLGALGLLLGQRADSRTITDKSRKTVVEAVIESGERRAESVEGRAESGERRAESVEGRAESGERRAESGEWRAESGEVIVRREILPSGRSRAFIDDSPVTLDVLADYTTRMLDIHSQHANLRLNSEKGQLEIIDAMAGVEGLLEEYRKKFNEYAELRSQIRKMDQQSKELAFRKEYLEDSLAELRKLNVKPGEHAEVEQRFEMLSQADEIKRCIGEAYGALEQREGSALDMIREAIMALEPLGEGFFGEWRAESGEDNILVRLRNLSIELRDIAEELDRKGEGITSSRHMLEATETRMREILGSVKRFHVNDGDELAELRDNMEAEMRQIEGNTPERSEMDRKAREMAGELRGLAAQLSERRRAGAEEFAKELMERTRPLGLPNLRFEVGFEEHKLNAEGKDRVTFLCSFNKNGEMMPMSATASGGELSRLTLGIKSLMADRMRMPTVIFDEIDTGVSGDIAHKMGEMMARMGERMQIIAITHLPQVAALGKRQYKVYKEDDDERTRSDIRELTKKERIEEIAAMISGSEITPAAIRAAKALL